MAICLPKLKVHSLQLIQSNNKMEKAAAKLHRKAVRYVMEFKLSSFSPPVFAWLALVLTLTLT